MSHSQWIESVVADTVKNNGFHEEYSIKMYADNAKSDHFGSDMTFVEVFQKNNDKKPVFNLLLKYEPLNPEFKKTITIVTDLFRREINIYTKIIPRYHKLQKDKNQPPFDSIPKCFYTKETENEEVIVLENIKPYGFMLHPKEKSMNSAHLRLLLKNLAQWHALSFALKDQHFDEFTTLYEMHKGSPWADIHDTYMGKVIEYSHKTLYGILEETEENEVLNKFKAKFKNSGTREVMRSLLDEDKIEKHAILIHGDCWNSNFMFQYKDESHTEPTKVKFLDFQVSSLRSPIIDISQLIYTTASSTEFDNIKELLMDYYNELAKNIKSLGSDPEKIFSLNDFKEQWHKYNAHGVIVALLAPIFLNVDDGPLDIANEAANLKILPKQVAKTVYRNRVTDVAKCFAMFEF